MRRHLAAAFALLISMSGAARANGRSWDDCLAHPSRDCVLNAAIDQVYLMDRTDRRNSLLASVAEARAKAGEIDQALELAAQVSDHSLARVAVEREIAQAQARVSHRKEAAAAFDRALQLAYGWPDPMERAEALSAIAAAQARAGLLQAADVTIDQAWQAAEMVRITGQRGRIVIPMPETKLAAQLRGLARWRAEHGEVALALQIAHAIAYDKTDQARTLLDIADLQMRAGGDVGPTLDDALALERQALSEKGDWPSIRDSGFPFDERPGRADVGLLCDIAKAQARAGLTAKASASFREALMRLTRGADPVLAPPLSLLEVADAQQQAGMGEAARDTAAKAVAAVDTIGGDLARAEALGRLAELQSKLGQPSQDAFARALSIARSLADHRQQSQALQQIAAAEANAGRREQAATTFAEAAGLAAEDGEMLASLADTERRAGYLAEAAATFTKALAAAMTGADRSRTFRLRAMICRIAVADQGTALLAASPPLRARLLEATEADPEPIGRAEMLALIGRSLPN